MDSIDPKLPPTALLCESCGYPLDGLERDGACPECGTDVDASLPARRPGSAWQRGEPSPWWSTIVDFAGQPREHFRRITIETARSRALTPVSTGIAAVLGTTPWLAILIIAHLDGSRGPSVWGSALLLLGVCGGAWLLMLAAVKIESLGIRFFAARRGWRVTPEVAAAVCAHACVGWVAGSAVAAGVAFFALLTALIAHSPMSFVFAVLGFFVGAGVGLLWFELLVYVGVRQCRFANPPTAVARFDDLNPAPAGTA